MVSLLLSQITFGANFRDNPGVGFAQLVEKLKQSKATIANLSNNKSSYQVLVHSESVKAKLKKDYGKKDLEDLSEFLKPITSIKVNERGIVQAADRLIDNQDDPTHYDAVWVRDSLWAYLGLRAQEDKNAKQVLLTLLDYVSTPDQLHRFYSVIKNPALLKKADGRMNAVHIRFDGRSMEFKDVLIDKKSQSWNHKQNDALGLLLDLSLRAIKSGEILRSDLQKKHYEALASFPAYFFAVKFWEMEDAGSWEEIERTNSSSIGLVISGLEQLLGLINSKENEQKEYVRKLRDAAIKKKFKFQYTSLSVKKLIDAGYSRLFKQLKAGGESPLYPENSRRFRKADAALLNLIFPAKLSRLSKRHRDDIFIILQPLIGRVGIKRYLLDSYQSGNFWFNQFETVVDLSGENETRSAKEFAERKKQFIPDTEAQWFFDSWYSKAMGVMFEEYKDPQYREREIEYFNRALGQITGEDAREIMGADGRSAAPLALPESYNSVVSGDAQYLCPSPITPLNWSKAAMAIAAAQLIANTGSKTQ